MGGKRYLECGTIRPGRECPFMNPDGCDFPGECQPILKQCKGCSHIETWNGEIYCSVYPQPLLKWAEGTCNTASHLRKRIEPNERGIVPVKAPKKGRKKDGIR